MNPEKKKRLINEIFVLIATIGALVIIVRLWPILLLLLIGLIVYAFWMLFHIQRQPVKSDPVPTLMLPPPTSERSVLTAAFGLLQRRITEQVALKYPDARWIWSMSDAFGQFSEGRPLTILLNGAGGYRKAAVQVKDLQLVGLVYESVQGSDVPETESESGEPEDGEHSQQPEPVDYGLLAFEWVEANLQRLISQSNEAVACGQSGFRIPAEELPHGDSWPAVCTELVRNGFASAAPLADGIQVEIKTE